MRGISTVVAVVLLTALMPGRAGPAESSRPEKATPPGQIDVITINVKQGDVIGPREFKRLFETAQTLHSRPEAFNGGASGAVMVPDVVVVQEMRHSNLEIFRLLMNQRFDTAQYRDVGPPNRDLGILANVKKVTPVGEVMMFNDVCVTPATPLEGGRTSRPYPIARFIENRTGMPFTVAGVHFAKNYRPTGQDDCRFRNAVALRAVLSAETSPVILTGDFNQRAAVEERECDLEERSEPATWYQALTEPDNDGGEFSDAVREWHRARRVSMVNEWTFERPRETPMCDGSTGHRRGRIDYVFASRSVVAEAHADHPGWSGGQPRVKHRSNFKYSDHRFVWARLVISGPPRPAPPATATGKGGSINLTWSPVAGATRWVVLRASPGSRYRALKRLPSEQTVFADTSTRHGTAYRYAIVAVGADGGWSRESRAGTATADAIGPTVVGMEPRASATGVDTGTSINVRLDEGVNAASVDSVSIRLFRGDRQVDGRVSQPGRRALIFDPAVRLKKGATYRVVVRGLRDALGNVGPRFAWRFTTERPRRR